MAETTYTIEMEIPSCTGVKWDRLTFADTRSEKKARERLGQLRRSYSNENFILVKVTREVLV